MAEKQKDQRQQEPQQSVIGKALITGFIAGILWSGLGTIAYYFNFTQVSPASFIFRSFWQTDWTGTWLAEVLAVVIIGILSLGTALLYYLTMKKLNGIWPGMLFGIALWAVVYLVLTPVFPAIPTFLDLNSDTWVTTGCLFILYGVFIGYSISYEYREFNETANSYSNEGRI
ncbi:Conserved membrane protein YqhR [Halobacillus dabanensis]|uniref:Conserved membrane protein YqhR n=1 Tax=Halobacillus dabanensis TaxID=240302 RepID=A0A1I3PK61_HALDA|nr:YqhR family membrane protein [Halobacillus dabanensis]SFJ21737.1 Conserved membrane protein YqhR [Halobacillus dabanensis]